MKKIVKFILDLLFPIECLGCGQADQWLCPSCLNKIKLNFDGRPQAQNKDCGLSGVWVAADYRDPLLAGAIKSFKYDFVSDLGGSLAEVLQRYLAIKINNQEISNFDLVVPVPLSRKRHLWRGFNQAEILASIIGAKFGWPICTALLFRQANNRPQVGLGAAARQKNVKGIFTIKNGAEFKGKKILLIDDVLTSGATLSECAKALAAAGAGEIWGLVLAQG